MKGCLDGWVDASVDKWKNTLHVPMEQNVNQVSSADDL
jgi:hypothetical protein